MTPTKLAIAAALVLSLGLTGCGKKAIGSTEEANARAARIGVVEARPMAGGLSTSGVLVSREEAAVSAELTGYAVARVLVEPPAESPTNVLLELAVAMPPAEKLGTGSLPDFATMRTSS